VQSRYLECIGLTQYFFIRRAVRTNLHRGLHGAEHPFFRDTQTYARVNLEMLRKKEIKKKKVKFSVELLPLINMVNGSHEKK